MRIKTKLYFFSAFSALLLLMTFLFVFKLSHDEIRLIKKTKVINSITKAVSEINILTNDYVFDQSEMTVKQWFMRYGSLTKLIESIEIDGKEESVLEAELRNQHEMVKSVFSQLMNENVGFARLQSASSKADDLKERIVEKLLLTTQSMVGTATKFSNKMIQNLISINRRFNFILTGISVMVLSLLFTISLFFENSVLKPMVDLRNAARSVGEGNLDFKIGMAANNEIGELSASFDQMTEKLKTITVSRDELENEVKNRKQTESTLRESMELFKAVFEQTGGYCMILQPTEDGIPTILDASNSACKAHGYTREEMLGRPVSDLDDEEGKRSCRERTKFILSGNTLNIENKHVRKDGSVFPVSVFANIVRFENKPPVILTAEFDISGRRLIESEKVILESKLQQARKMESIGTLAGGIAHDFNNILSAILGYAELAMSNVERGTILEDDLREIFIAGNRAKELVSQILMFARQSSEDLKPIQANLIVHEVLKFIRSSIPTTIQIEEEIKSDSLILGSATQLHQIFMNVMTNAAHAMDSEGGILKVIVEDVHVGEDLLPQLQGLKSGDYLKVLISDTGLGIPSNIIDSIFEPYFTTKKSGEGTGMGLAVVHGIVESYNGKITVDSLEGQGTTFRIYLPLTKKRKQDDFSEPLELRGGSERILFVDDEVAIAKMGGLILGKLGYCVTTETESVKALELFKSKPFDFDLIISDVTMPNMSGDKLAKKILEIRADIPIILCTGYSRKISNESPTLIGVKAIANKPITKSDLSKLVHKVLLENKSKSNSKVSPPY